MKTDLDRLHKVVLGELNRRRAGVTYAQCHEVAGILETTDTGEIIIFVSYFKDTYYIVPMLLDILKEHMITNFEIQFPQATIKVKNRKIIFIPISQLPIRGRDNYYIVNMRRI